MSRSKYATTHPSSVHAVNRPIGYTIDSDHPGNCKVLQYLGRSKKILDTPNKCDHS